jgi:hypothetical protein
MAEQARLTREIETITAERDELRTKFEEKLEEKVEALRNDPTALREAMLRAGRGQ